MHHTYFCPFIVVVQLMESITLIKIKKIYANITEKRNEQVITSPPMPGYCLPLDVLSAFSIDSFL